MIETYNLNPLAKAWVEALLSGGYQQGSGTLRAASNEFCCLGVAADLINPNGWVDDLVVPRFKWGPDGYTEVLPFETWAELMAGASHIPDQQILAEANDSGATFEEIVHDYILPAFAGPTLMEEVDAAY